MRRNRGTPKMDGLMLISCEPTVRNSNNDIPILQSTNAFISLHIQFRRKHILNSDLFLVGNRFQMPAPKSTRILVLLKAKVSNSSLGVWGFLKAELPAAIHTHTHTREACQSARLAALAANNPTKVGIWQGSIKGTSRNLGCPPIPHSKRLNIQKSSGDAEGMPGSHQETTCLKNKQDPRNQAVVQVGRLKCPCSKLGRSIRMPRPRDLRPACSPEADPLAVPHLDVPFIGGENMAREKRATGETDDCSVRIQEPPRVGCGQA